MSTNFDNFQGLIANRNLKDDFVPPPSSPQHGGDDSDQLHEPITCNRGHTLIEYNGSFVLNLSKYLCLK